MEGNNSEELPLTPRSPARPSLEEIHFDLNNNPLLTSNGSSSPPPPAPARPRWSAKRATMKRGSTHPEKQVASWSTGDPYSDELLKRLNGSRPLSEGLSLERDYTLKNKLGEGAFAKVYMAIHKESGKKVALKVVSLEEKDIPAPSNPRLLGRSKSNVASFEKKIKTNRLRKRIRILDNEISMMKKIQKFSSKERSSLVKLIDVMASKDKIVFSMELLSGGELFDRVQQKEKYSERDAAFIIRRIMRGIKTLHAHNIVHRDLKPENLVFETMEEDSKIKIADLGLSFVQGEDDLFRKGLVGSPGYMSPEILSSKNYTKAGDIWAMGVILFILLVGGPPFSGATNEELFENIKTGTYSYPPNCGLSKESRDLVSKMLTVSSTERWTASQVLMHPWLNKKANTAQLLSSLGHLRTFNARKKLKQFALGLAWNTKSTRATQLRELLLGSSKEDGFTGEELNNIRDFLFEISAEAKIQASASTRNARKLSNNIIKQNKHLFDEIDNILDAEKDQKTPQTDQNQPNHAKISKDIIVASADKLETPEEPVKPVQPPSRVSNVTTKLTRKERKKARQASVTLEQFTSVFTNLNLESLPLEKIFKIFADDSEKSSVAEICVGLSTVAKSWTGQDALRYCFDTYDRNGQGEISKADVSRILKVIMGEDLFDKMATGLNNVLGSVWRKSPKLSFSDFKAAVLTQQNGEWNMKDKFIQPVTRTLSTAVRKMSMIGHTGVNKATGISSTFSLATIKTSMTLMWGFDDSTTLTRKSKNMRLSNRFSMKTQGNTRQSHVNSSAGSLYLHKPLSPGLIKSHSQRGKKLRKTRPSSGRSASTWQEDDMKTVADDDDEEDDRETQGWQETESVYSLGSNFNQHMSNGSIQVEDLNTLMSALRRHSQISQEEQQILDAEANRSLDARSRFLSHTSTQQSRRSKGKRNTRRLLPKVRSAKNLANLAGLLSKLTGNNKNKEIKSQRKLKPGIPRNLSSSTGKTRQTRKTSSRHEQQIIDSFGGVENFMKHKQIIKASSVAGSSSHLLRSRARNSTKKSKKRRAYLIREVDNLTVRERETEIEMSLEIGSGRQFFPRPRPPLPKTPPKAKEMDKKFSGWNLNTFAVDSEL